MKIFTKIFLSIVIALMIVPLSASAKKDKEKAPKVKRPFEWVMPELTGNEDFDTYLLTCDTLYNSIRTFADEIPVYNVVYHRVPDPEDPTKCLYNEDGTPELTAHIEDVDGKVRNTGGVLAQYAEIIFTGTNLLLECTNITVLTASATASLPSLGLGAISYAKYVKAGPVIANMGLAECKEIVERLKTQSAEIKALKEGSSTEGELSDVIMSVTNLPEGVVAEDLPIMSEEKIAECEAAASELDAQSTDDMI